MRVEVCAGPIFRNLPASDVEDQAGIFAPIARSAGNEVCEAAGEDDSGP